jgi:hypothetical protein
MVISKKIKPNFELDKCCNFRHCGNRIMSLSERSATEPFGRVSEVLQVALL